MGDIGTRFTGVVGKGNLQEIPAQRRPSSPTFSGSIAAAGKKPMQYGEINGPLNVKVVAASFEQRSNYFLNPAFLPEPPKDKVRPDPLYRDSLSFSGPGQLSIDVFGHDRFELFFAPRQPRHNRADRYFESFGNLFVRKLAQVKELHYGPVFNVDSQKSIEDDSRIQGSPRLRFPCRRIVNISYKLRFEVLFPETNCA